MQTRGEDEHLLPNPARPSSGFDMINPNRPKPAEGDAHNDTGKTLDGEFSNTTGAVRVDHTRRKAPEGNPFGVEYEDEIPHYAQDRTLNWV